MVYKMSLIGHSHDSDVLKYMDPFNSFEHHKMSISQSLDLWRVVELLSDDREPPFIDKVQSLEEAMVALVGTDERTRQAALEYIDKLNKNRKILWGSIATYLVFYYHLLFERTDIKSAEVVRTLLSNTTKTNDVSEGEEKILQLLTKGHEVIRGGTSNIVARQLENEFVKSDGDELIELVGRLIYVKIGGMTDLNPYILRLKNAIKKVDVDEEVAEHYLVPTYETKQPIDNYFLTRAEKEESQLSAYRYLLMKKENLIRKRDQKINRIKSSKGLRYSITIIVSVLAVSGAMVYTFIVAPPAVSEDGSLNITAQTIVVWVVSVLFVLFTVPFSKLPPLLINGIAWLAVLKEKGQLSTNEKEIREIPNLSNEPKSF